MNTAPLATEYDVVSCQTCKHWTDCKEYCFKTSGNFPRPPRFENWTPSEIYKIGIEVGKKIGKKMK